MPVCNEVFEVSSFNSCFTSLETQLIEIWEKNVDFRNEFCWLVEWTVLYCLQECESIKSTPELICLSFVSTPFLFLPFYIFVRGTLEYSADFQKVISFVQSQLHHCPCNKHTNLHLWNISFHSSNKQICRHEQQFKLQSIHSERPITGLM